jgi:hypothetical protein
LNGNSWFASLSGSNRESMSFVMYLIY